VGWVASARGTVLTAGSSAAGAAAERVIRVVRAVPPGYVTTYGDVARSAGLTSPRQVGRILARETGTIPWYRVVRADGTLAGAVAVEQSRRLRAEGVVVTGQRVDLPRYRW
jgi:alkylated DNA nucleotide flippase Atl1